MLKTVTFIGQFEYFACCMPDTVPGYSVIKKHLDFNRLDELRGLQSDVFIIFRPDFIPVDILKSLTGKKIWISSEPIEREDVIPSYRKMMIRFSDWDGIYHYDRSHLRLMEQMHIKAEEFVLPVNLRIMNAHFSRKDLDIFFAGRSTTHREMLMGSLKRDYKLFHAAHGLIDDDFAYFVSRSKICLNLNISKYGQLQHRLQNMIACNGFVLSEKQTHNDGLKAGTHYIQFNSAQDLYDKVNYYLDHEDERNAIAEAGMNYVKENLNADKSWEQILQKVNYLIPA